MIITDTNKDSIKCYCIFCNTQKCEQIASALNDRESMQAIYPMHVQHTWSKGKMTDIVRSLTPGYIFVYYYGSDDVDGLWMQSSKGRNMLPNGFYYCLKYRDGTYELRDSDRSFALMLLENKGIIGKTEVFEEGDRIRFKDGAFAGVQSDILKVDRRNGRMQIEIEFAGRKIKTWVEFEVVEKAEETCYEKSSII